MTRRGTLLALLTAALAGGLVACGDEDSPPKEASAKPRAAAPAVQGSFEVAGHKLHLTCHGNGSPTVVYLHGYIHDPSGGGAGNAGEIPGLLAANRRVCVYDRVNVGRSGSVKGRQTARDSVEDLHALLAAADVPGPYVLLGASFGGLIAQLYAGTHPDDVAGMVLLDASLPEDVEIDRRYVPEGDRLAPGDWKPTTERIDQLASYRQLEAVGSRLPRIPVTYIGIETLELGPHWPVEEITAAVREAQRKLVGRFSPGRLIVLDVPHYMEPEIPERIAQEVERVIAAGKGG